MNLQELLEKAVSYDRAMNEGKRNLEETIKEARIFCEKNLLGRCFKTYRPSIEGDSSNPTYYAVTEIKKWHDWEEDFDVVYVEVGRGKIEKCQDSGDNIWEYCDFLGDLSFIDTSGYYHIEEVSREEFITQMKKVQQTLIDRVNNITNEEKQL